MTEQLADLLADRLRTDLPLLDRVTGLVRTYEHDTPDGENDRGEVQVRRVKLPVPVAFTADDCQRDPRYLLPDAGTAGIAFFEDYGTVPQPVPGAGPSVRAWLSTLRLLLWVNPLRLDGPLAENVLLVAIEQALSVGKRFASGDYLDVLVSYTTLPADGVSLFGRYTHAGETPLLYPPYRVLGLELRVSFRLTTRCQEHTLPGVIPAPHMLTLLFWLHALLTAAAAVVFADLLVQQGMLLAPVQRWLRERYRHVKATESPLRIHELDDQMWWKPLWGCPTCVAGQWGFWAYLYHYHAAYFGYQHVYFVVLALLFSLMLQKLLRWTQQ